MRILFRHRVFRALRALLALVISSIKVTGRAPVGKDDCKDGRNTVAVVVKNGGDAESDPFAVRLIADGDDANQQSVSGLGAGQEREVRFDDVRLKKGEHTLAAIADAKASVDESDENNNELKATARCKAAE